MAPRRALLGTAVKYAVRYGPVVVPLVRQAQGPAQEAARRAWDVRRAERTAETHASTLRQGTVLPVVHEGRRCWVVFSADEPVAVYPPTDVPVMTLLLHADLDRRRPPRPRGHAARSAPAGAPAGDRAPHPGQGLRGAFVEGWRARREAASGGDLERPVEPQDPAGG